MNRIPTLDGWRGIAIAFVLFEHIQLGLGGLIRPWTETGQHGVNIFFVLSGFLITANLLQGPIDLKRFYIRRFFRLMPAAWSYLAALWLFGAVAGLRMISLSETNACVFFYRNFQNTGLSRAAFHYWSLSLEEQFYLVWPCLLAIAGPRLCKWLAAGSALGIAGWRMEHWAYFDRSPMKYLTVVRADALLVGCLLALALRSESGRAVIHRFAKWWAGPALAGLFFYISRYHDLPPLGESLCIAALLAACIAYPKAVLVGWLDFRPLAWLGLVSYSLYVWQQFFWLPYSRPVTLTLLCIMPFFALGSYYFIEKPCVRFAHRITRREDPGSDNLFLAAPSIRVPQLQEAAQ